MDGGFACPECGGEIRLTGLSPGRRVRCGWCRTSVEVPFLPRAEPVLRLRRPRRSAWGGRWPVWLKATVIGLGLAIAVAGLWRGARSQRRKAEAEAVARLVALSRADEASGRLGEALAEIEAALIQAARLKPTPGDLGELRACRDRLARREVEAQLSALDARATGEEPGRSVGRALTLLARVRKDEALDGLEPKVRETLEQLRLRWVEADATAAEAAEAAGKSGEALTLCRRQYANADDLAAAARNLWRGRARALAGRIIAQRGAVIEPVRGQFTLGSPATYARLFFPALTRSLQRQGYLPRPAGSPWDDLWAAAPYRVSLEVKERLDETYLESQNRISTIEAHLTLSREGRSIWFERTVTRTRVPLPGLRAYQASRNSVGTHRSPEFERLLYDDARDDLVGRLSSYLVRLPAGPATPR